MLSEVRICHGKGRSVSSPESASGLDNRKICDDGTSQELTEGDIKVMKGQGISGQVCTNLPDLYPPILEGGKKCLLGYSKVPQ